MTTSTSTRLPAAERRQALVDAALRVFMARSYRGSTTAEIAREAGVSEPILYRHFPSKRDLYFACLDRAWASLRELWQAAMTTESEPLVALGRCYLDLKERKLLLAELWMQAVTEAAEDAEIRDHLRSHVREVHDFVSGAIRDAQACGSVAGERDAEAEAWIFLAVGLLATLGRRVGALLTEEDFKRIREARVQWMTGG